MRGDAGRNNGDVFTGQITVDCAIALSPDTSFTWCGVNQDGFVRQGHPW